MLTFPSLAVPEVVILTSSGAGWDEYFMDMITFPSKWQLPAQPVTTILSKSWHFRFNDKWYSHIWQGSLVGDISSSQRSHMITLEVGIWYYQMNVCWQLRVVMMPTLSALVALGLVAMKHIKYCYLRHHHCLCTLCSIDKCQNIYTHNVDQY